MRVLCGVGSWARRAAILWLACVLSAPVVLANPKGGTVTIGSATFQVQGPQLTIQTSSLAYLNWQSFNIAPGETTTFVQPSSTSVVFNQINDANPSQILGSLNANGYIFLQNASGFYVGGQASIHTGGGFVMTTAPLALPDLGQAGFWAFSAPPPTAKIVNYGRISVGNGGSAFLIADDVENHGSIEAAGGNIGLYAGEQVLVSERPDGRGLSASVTLPQGSVSNDGRLIADGGDIVLNAQVVNQGGMIQADSVRDVGGTIELVAGDAVNLGADSVIAARGDSQGVSSGGSVTIKSGGTFTDAAGSSIDVSGGAEGGNGGQVEISAPGMTEIQSAIQGGAAPGWLGGGLSIDPLNIVLSSAGSSAPASGTVPVGSAPTTGTLTLNVNSFTGMSQIDLQASQNITVSTGWNLGDSATPGSVLTLQAGGNIGITSGDYIDAGKNWTVDLVAGANFSTLTSVTPGVGSITLSGNNPLQTVNGGIGLFAGENININGSWELTDINVPETLGMQAGNNISFGKSANLSLDMDWSANLQAGLNFQPGAAVVASSGGVYLNNGTGQPSYIAGMNGDIDISAFNEVIVGGGGISTYDGGNISVTAANGDINCGKNTEGYVFNGTTGYSISPYTEGGGIEVGGISTAMGGNVTLTAGLDVISELPQVRTLVTDSGDAGSGAFGSEPGVVTVTAGRNVAGHFVAADSFQNGVPVASTINAGLNAGSSAGLLALSLVKGGWEVNAPNGSIDLQEVRDPNGALNSLAGPDEHQFDYAAQSFVVLNAGNQVQLGSTVNFGTTTVPAIFPPSLTIDAGPGGVQLDANITLYPSPYGNLNITTTGGGWLYAMQSSSTPEQEAGVNFDLTMSDSSRTQWVIPALAGGVVVFGPNDHAAVPVQLDNPEPVELNISGDLSDLTLSFPKAADINVGGDMLNTHFLGQNLHAGDVTSINVAGKLFFRSQATYYQLSAPLAAYEDTDALIDTLLANAYDASGNSLVSALAGVSFQYNPDTLQVSFLGRMTLAQYQGLLEIASEQLVVNGQALNPVPVTFLTPAAITALYLGSQNVPQSGVNTGLKLAGPGEFKITAGSIALPDNGAGIATTGAALNPALARLGASGASIDVTTTSGDLTMDDSFISTYAGGGIDINSAGAVEVGSAENFGFPHLTPPTPLGIYVEGPGNLSITAEGNVDVAGSRVETFGGGNINVLSLNGNIDAGNGADGTFTPTVFHSDPTTGQVDQIMPQFSGSGIEALTLPASLVGVDQNGKAVTLDFGDTTLPGNISLTTPHGNIVASSGGILQEPLDGNSSPGPVVTLTAGSRDAKGNVTFQGNIDVSGSGVVGEAVSANATGTINGLLIGSQSVTINTPQAFSGTVVSAGSANINASSVSGNIVAVSGINIGEGAVVSANLLSQNVSVGGAAGPALASTATASAASQSASQDSTTQAKAAAGLEPSEDTGDDLLKKGKGKGGVKLGRASRVTVIL